MAELSYGSVLTCILVTSFIMLYLILLNQKKEVHCSVWGRRFPCAYPTPHSAGGSAL